MRKTAFFLSVAAMFVAALTIATSAGADVDMTGRLVQVKPKTHQRTGVKPLATSANGTYRCAYEYSVVANWYYYFALGNCRSGWELEVVSYASENSSTHEHSYGGFVNHAFSGCGWIDTRFPLEKLNNNGHSACAGGGASREFKVEESSFMEKYSHGTAGDGNPVINPQPCPEYANYRPWSTNNVEKEAIRTVPAYAGSQPGSNYPALKWRYVTKYASTDGTGKYVMVRDDRITGAGEGNWVFVPLSCLRGSPAELPENAEERLPPPPTAITGGNSNITAGTATLSGSINPNGLDTHYFIEWGKEANKPNENFAPRPYPGEDLGGGTGSVNRSVTATGLSPNTVYYYRLVASSPTGISEGGTGSFKTLPIPPTVNTEGYNNLQEVEVQEAQVTLTGAVNPNGDDTHYYFQYGPTTAYGLTAPGLPGADAGAGTSGVGVSTPVNGLSGGTVYHYRLVATNAHNETTYGGDRTVETPLKPSVQMQVINGVKETVLEGPNHSLVQHWSTSEGWKTFTIAGEGTTYSSPQFVVQGPNLEVYVQGPNHTLMQYYATSEGWKHFQVTPENEVYSNPVLQEIGGVTELVVQGPNHSLVQHWSTSEGWKTFTIAGEGTTYSSPQFVVQGSNLEVYVQGPTHDLMQYYATSEGWKHFQVTPDNEVYSNPVLQEIGGVTELVVQGPNHALVQHWSTSEGWKTFTIAGEGTTYSNPQFAVVGTVLEIFVQGPTHDLMQYYSTSEGWKHFQVTPDNEVYSNPMVQVFPNGPAEVYVEGGNKTLVQHWSTEQGWGTFIVANNAFS